MASLPATSLEQLQKIFSELDAATIINSTRAYSTEAYTALTQALRANADKMNEDTVRDMFTVALRFCEDNPLQAAGLVLMFISFVAPAALWGPFAGVLGFTRLGPAANSAASFFQSRFGTVWAFRIFQSAKMSGFGVTAMNVVTQGAAVAFSAATWAYNSTLSFAKAKI